MKIKNFLLMAVLGLSMTFTSCDDILGEWSRPVVNTNTGSTPKQGALTGKFTINAEGKQVYFSQGNLQATYNGSSWIWAFAEHQYDYIGNATANNAVNGSMAVSAIGTVDLFGWNGGNSTHYGINNSTTDSDYGNSTSDVLNDWGNLAISNGGNVANSGWRTLTKDEWTYIFMTRTSGSTVNSIENARYTKAVINTDGTAVQGVILFPDGVTIENSEATLWGPFNASSDYGDQCKCTTAQWTALEAKGCVFLPAAGGRTGSTVTGDGSAARYWSSTPNGTSASDAYFLHFGTSYLSPSGNGQRKVAVSVRLVCQVE